MVDYKSRWDESIGLFLLPPEKKGHTLDCFRMRNLHSNPDSVSFITHAAQTGRLDEVDAERILANIRKCQFRDAEKAGQIKWFLEDQNKSDKNASFFICIGLIPLRKYYSKSLGVKSIKILDEILSDVLQFFLKKCDEANYYYVNSFLGDLVFAWLLNEMYGDKSAEIKLTRLLDDSMSYWLDEHWGWGEHMSDSYSKVCCFEISMLLLMSKRLPESVRDAYMNALTFLLEIEESYGGKPRVPTIRSYAFENSPVTHPFRNTIREFSVDDETVIENLPAIGHILHELDWHGTAPAPTVVKKEMSVPCRGGVEASALIDNDFRIGALSRYPIMDCTAYLPWQVFPVAFLHNDGDWGFLQWLSLEDGTTFAHPSHTKDYGIDRGLSTKVRPPIQGETFSIRDSGNLLVMRRMPAISLAWTKLVDRLRVVSPIAKRMERKLDERCSTLSFKWANGRTLSVARATLSNVPEHLPVRIDGNVLDWDISYSKFPAMNETVTLWAFAVDSDIVEPPTVMKSPLRKRPADPENQPFNLEWRTGEHDWRITVDPVEGRLTKQ